MFDVRSGGKMREETPKIAFDICVCSSLEVSLGKRGLFVG
jgi:hypothetical protein